MNKNIINISNKRVAFYGAIIAVSTVFFYSLMVMIYVVIRSSLTIYEILLSEVRTLTLLQSGISVAYSIAIFSMLMAIISSIIGIITANILKKTIRYFNPNFKNRKSILISGIIAVLAISVVYISLRMMLKDWLTLDYIETFLFWFLLPSLLFFIACIIGGKQLNMAFLNNLRTLVKVVKIGKRQG